MDQLDEAADVDEPEVIEGEVVAPELEDDELVVTIGDAPAPEEEPEQAPEWVKELRKSNREKDRALKEIQRELEAYKAPKAAPVVKKPTLEGCDYDADKFEAELLAWNEADRAAKAEAKAREEAQQAEKDEWQKRLDTYNAAKKTLKVRDYDDAEATARDALTTTQQGIILEASDNPALMVYAIGSNPETLKELSKISNPIKFAVAVAKLDGKLKAEPRKSITPPESTVKGSAPLATGRNLDALREAAERTGDYTAYLAAKRAAKK